MPDVIPTASASLVILRETGGILEVLMGRRRDTARFMPGYLVYPGGAVDPVDHALSDLYGETVFHHAALRETWEETEIAIAGADAAPEGLDGTDPYCQFLSRNALRPMAGELRYIARAITPRRSPIRFDARFFLSNTNYVQGTAKAMGELPEVDWISTKTALTHKRLSDVTRFVLRQALAAWETMDHWEYDPYASVNCLTYDGNRHVITAETAESGLITF